MSNQDILIPGQKGMTNVPSYAQADENTNLLGDLGGRSINRLTFKGNRFRVVSGEEENVLEDNKLAVVMLEAYPKVSRLFYGSKYSADSENTRPVCASADGERPLSSITSPQHASCNLCPQNQKGSAIGDDGGKRRACSYFKRVAFLLVKYPEIGPVVSDLKAMTLFGESYPDSGLLNLRAYAEKLAKHRTKPEALITEMSFDHKSSVPKVLFRALQYVDEDFYRDTIQPMIESGELAGLVDTTQIRTDGEDDDATPAQPEGGGFRDRLLPPGEEEKPTPPKATKKKAAKKKAAKKPEPEPEPEPAKPEATQESSEFDDELDKALAEWDDWGDDGDDGDDEEEDEEAED